MRLFQYRSAALLAVGFLCVPGLLLAAGQAIVLHQNLSEMSAAADRVYRGTVYAIEEGQVEFGTGSLPATTYRISVTEQFKGDVDQRKGDQGLVELRVVGTSKPILRQEGELTVLPVLPELPRLAIGQDYLFFTNAPNTYGLSNTIGLGQGYFLITGVGKNELAANQLDNLGLFKGMGAGLPAKGAIAYAELADLIRAEVGQ